VRQVRRRRVKLACCAEDFALCAARALWNARDLAVVRIATAAGLLGDMLRALPTLSRVLQSDAAALARPASAQLAPLLQLLTGAPPKWIELRYRFRARPVDVNHNGENILFEFECRPQTVYREALFRRIHLPSPAPWTVPEDVVVMFGLRSDSGTFKYLLEPPGLVFFSGTHPFVSSFRYSYSWWHRGEGRASEGACMNLHPTNLP
jgi:hypothetical protein